MVGVPRHTTEEKAVYLLQIIACLSPIIILAIARVWWETK